MAGLSYEQTYSFLSRIKENTNRKLLTWKFDSTQHRFIAYTADFAYAISDNDGDGSPPFTFTVWKRDEIEPLLKIETSISEVFDSKSTVLNMLIQETFEAAEGSARGYMDLYDALI